MGTLRPYLKKTGPQTAIDIIVANCFFSLASESKANFKIFIICEMTLFTAGLGSFLMQYITTGSEINRRYLSTSILLTEQMNIYFKMEQKPKKKDELTRANSILQLTQRLLNEVQSPHRIHG